jgi:hypothetical protein
MKPLLAQAQQVLDAADHAAAQSDHWLFIAALIVLGVVLYAMWRKMVSDQEKLGDRLTDVTDRHIASCESMTKVVANNTAMLERVEKKL